MTVCVYALTSGTARPPGSGLSGERLRLVAEGPIAAVVGELLRVPRPSHENLRRYDRTVRGLAASLPAVLPARFGTCFDDPDELRYVLRSRRSSLSRALARVRNRVQMTIRIVGQPRTRAAARAGAASRGGATGTAYLHARAAAAAREREIPGFDTVRDRVRRWLRDERVENRPSVITVYHLVPRTAADAYRRAVERAAASAGLQIVVSGPWPAYAFAADW